MPASGAEHLGRRKSRRQAGSAVMLPPKGALPGVLEQGLKQLLRQYDRAA